MKRIFCVNGRLPWPWIAGIGYVSASLFVLDYLWRLLVMPFGTFVLYAMFVHGAAAVLVLCAYLLLRRRQANA